MSINAKRFFGNENVWENAEYITDKKKELTDAERFDTLILISKSIRGMRET